MSLYRYLEYKFVNCAEPNVGAKLTQVITTKPDCFDMAVYMTGVGMVFCVDRSDKITFKREIPTAHYNRLGNFFYSIKPNTALMISKRTEIKYERFPVRVRCAVTEEHFPLVEGLEITFTLGDQPLVGGVKMKDPHRHIDQTRQRQLNDRIKECMSEVEPFLVMAWDTKGYRRYTLPDNCRDSVTKLDPATAFDNFLQDPQDTDTLFSLEGAFINTESLQRKVNGKLKREYMVRQEIIHYEYQ